MKFIKFAAVLIALLQLDEALGNPVSPCVSPDGSVSQITVSGCTAADPVCILHKGKSTTIEMNITSKSTANSLKVKLTGEIAGVTLPFPVNPDEACGHYVEHCPVKSGESNHFKLSIPIMQIYPSVPVKVRLTVTDDQQKNVACVEIKSKIQ